MNPSLLLIPDRYKAAKLYSQIPDSGAGDLTFARNSNATRVNSEGLIEKVRTNLLTYSNTFSDAAWTKNNLTLTAGQVDPDGGTNATRAEFSGVSYIFQAPSTAFATASIYVRATSGTANIRIGDSNGNFVVAYALTESWQRITAFGATMAGISIDSFIGGSWTAQDVIIAFAQFETGDIATPYIPTTTAAVSVGITADIPRLDYTGGGCPSLLLEPQRTNLITFSEQFNNAGWSKSGNGTGSAPVVTANNSISPDGTMNADTVVFNSGAGTTASDFSSLFQTFGGTTAIYTGSFYAKTASGTAQVQVRIDGSIYDKFTITDEWQRFTLTKSLTGTSNVFEMTIRRGLNEPINASATIQLWGVQVELGSYPTSYIPSLGSSVTRLADAASKTGISSLIGQSEGSIYWEGIINGIPVDQTIFGVEKESSNFVIRFGGDGTSIYAQSYNGSTNLFFQTTTPSVGQKIKLAFAYKAGDYAFYKNGTLVASGTNASTIPACDKLQTNQLWSTAGGIGAYGTNDAALYPIRLSNAQLATLTAL
jgi:hypothetical protein